MYDKHANAYVSTSISDAYTDFQTTKISQCRTRIDRELTLLAAAIL